MAGGNTVQIDELFGVDASCKCEDEQCATINNPVHWVCVILILFLCSFSIIKIAI